jgi:hypothetical protein
MRIGSLGSVLRSSGRKARLIALAVSLALHATLAVLLLTGTPAPLALAPPPAPLEIEILAPSPELAPEEPRPVEPAADPTERAREQATAEDRRGPATPPRTGAPPQRSPAGTPPPGPTAATDRPDRDGATLQMRFPGALDLSLGYERVDKLTREGAIAPPDAVAMSAEGPRHPTFRERLADRVRYDGGRANVAKGEVHPQMYDLLRDARKGFNPDVVALDKDHRAPNTVGRSVKQWLGGLLQPRPYDREDELQMQPDGGRLGSPDVLRPDNRAALRGVGGYLGLGRGRSAAVKPMDCVVCVVLRPGAAPEVVLRESSGNAEIDNTAVESLRQATRARPLDSDVPPQKSCYRFRATVQRIPPVPIIGCGFDEVTMSARCYLPLQKVRRTSVTLESVDYGG